MILIAALLVIGATYVIARQADISNVTPRTATHDDDDNSIEGPESNAGQGDDDDDDEGIRLRINRKSVTSFGETLLPIAAIVVGTSFLGGIWTRLIKRYKH